MIISFYVEDYTIASKVILGFFFLGLACIIIYFVIKMMELAYVMRHRKPFYNHFYLFKRRLNKEQIKFLKNKFVFYNKLSSQEKVYFEHRLASFIADKDFIGRGGLQVTDEMKILISATAVMLTFGFRDFYIGLLSKIIIYPEIYFSKIDNNNHKGEFNPRLKALVISWKDFKFGYEVSNDNLNLGIHEFAHAIHLNCSNERDISSTIFSDSFNELMGILSQNVDLRSKLITSKYFRDYAYTNRFEFLAVIIETFIETPSEFKSQFPEVYYKVRQMLNFNFAGY